MRQEVKEVTVAGEHATAGSTDAETWEPQHKHKTSSAAQSQGKGQQIGKNRAYVAAGIWKEKNSHQL